MLTKTMLHLPFLTNGGVLQWKWKNERSEYKDNEWQQESKRVLLLQEVQPLAGGMPYQNPRKPTLHRQQRTKILAKKIHHWGGNNKETKFPYFSINKLRDTIERKPSGTATVTVEPVCVASFATCNKLFKIFAPGEKVQLRINVKMWSQTMSWLFDTGAAITCMNSRSFNAAFGSQNPKKISNTLSCVATSGDAMNSIGVYEVDLWIKGQKFTHPINVITELNDNIIGINFMHRNKLIYNVDTRQVKFTDSQMNTFAPPNNLQFQVWLQASSLQNSTARHIQKKHTLPPFIVRDHQHSLGYWQ